MAIKFAGTVQSPSAIPSIPFTEAPVPITLGGAQTFTIPPGPYKIWPANASQCTELQQYDGVLGIWRKATYPITHPMTIDSDGANFRLANTTGCAVAALITNGGTSYISAPTVTANFGGSVWQAIVGGSISSSVTVTTAGLYNYIPTLRFSDPPPGGVRGSATVSLSGSGLGTVTVVNAGAGYTSVPTITIVQDPRDSAAGGGVLTATLTNVGVVTAVVCVDPGTSTATSVPTLTFAGGLAASGGTAASATALMNFTVTGWTVTSVGSSLGTSLPLLVETEGYLSTGTSATTYLNPFLATNVAWSRAARLMGFTNSTGGVIASNTSLSTMDNGWGFQQTPSLITMANFNGALSGIISPVLAAVVGATTDTVEIQKLKS